MTKLIIFDLDGTLTESKQPLAPEMAALLARLLAVTPVAVISGGAFLQFQKQVIERLPSFSKFSNLYILPTSGAALYEFKSDAWKRVYEERISERDAALIEKALEDGAEESGVIDLRAKTWGPRLEYRGGQVTFSALGQEAPIAEKKKWDPDYAKRRTLQAAVAKHLPKGFAAAMGGATTIDVTKEGVDKAYGIHQLCTRLGIAEKDALYVGDELQKHGNDEAVYKTEAETKRVANPSETAVFIRSLLESR